MITQRRAIVLLMTLALAMPAYSGSLDPAAPPAPTMKPLDVVEPRTPISSVPFVINQSGSYYLTGNLQAAGAVDGIRVHGSAISVTIDLNGYSLIGPYPSSNGGIAIDAGNKIVSVRNGTVRGWAVGVTSDYGITVKLSHVTVEGSSYRGVQLYGGGEIENSAVIGSLEFGIVAGANTLIRDSKVIGNGYSGILLFGGSSSVESTFVSGNGNGGPLPQPSFRAGIWVQSAANRIVDCLVQNNSGDGIYLEDSNYVADNHLTQNGLAGLSIPAGTANRVEGNYVARNAAYGISVSGTGNILMRNTSTNNAAGHYSIGAGNIAPIDTATVTNLAYNIAY